MLLKITHRIRAILIRLSRDYSWTVLCTVIFVSCENVSLKVGDEKIQYSRGRKTEITYYSNGNLKEEVFYENGYKIEYKSYYENGKLKSTSPLKNDLVIGKSYSYFSTGDIHLEMTRDSNGLLNGIYKEYFENGRLLKTGSFLNDSTHGRWVSYYDNGDIIEENNFVNGVPHGLQKVYYRGSKLALEGKSDMGKKIDKWIFYTDLGDTSKIEIYEDGKLVNMIEKR